VKSIDAEIFEVEQRLHMRESSLKRNAGDLKTRTMKALMSPVSIVGAVALGFLVAGGVGRRKRAANAPAVSKETKEQSKGFAVGGLIMTALTWFLKSQFGGPVGFARYVISKVRKDGSPAPATPRLRTNY
jgi:hypothetical protein